MLNIFQRADQEKARGATVTARDLLETGRKDVMTRLAGQPRLQAELLQGIAKIQGRMGEYVSADDSLRAAHSGFRSGIRGGPESQRPRRSDLDGRRRRHSPRHRPGRRLPDRRVALRRQNPGQPRLIPLPKPAREDFSRRMSGFAPP
jgi:hypothetical protein